MVGVLDRDKSASKGVVTTTSEFALGVWEEFKEDARIAWNCGVGLPCANG